MPCPARKQVRSRTLPSGLLDLLAELSEHPLLKDKLALHGGTAINLFMLNIPRLSVDIHEQIPLRPIEQMRA